MFELKAALTRGDANDHKAQTRYVQMVKQACLDFRTTPINFNENKLEKKEILQLNAQLLIKIQSMINKTGVYDDFYRHYANKDFYLKPLLDYVTGNTIAS